MKHKMMSHTRTKSPSKGIHASGVSFVRPCLRADENDMNNDAELDEKIETRFPRLPVESVAAFGV